jgi:hypothetical protein
MPIFRYANVYLGFPAVIELKTDRTQTELSWSPDTIHWERIEPGKPLIVNAEKEGDYDWGTVHASRPIVRNGKILIYYGSCDGSHADWRNGYLCLATMRLDGFAGYQPQNAAEPAVIVTRPVTCGTEFRITADAQGGAVTVALVDDTGNVLAASRPVTADVTDLPLSWQQGTVDQLEGKRARLRFTFERARLYAFKL